MCFVLYYTYHLPIFIITSKYARAVQRHRKIDHKPWKCTLFAMHMNVQLMTLHEGYGKYEVSKSFTKEYLFSRVLNFALVLRLRYCF